MLESEVEQILSYFADTSSGFTLRSGAELGEEYEISAALAVKLAQDLEDLMKDHFESVQTFLMSLAKEHPEEVAFIVDGQAGPLSVELVRDIGDCLAKPVDAMTTQREEAGEDPTEQYRTFHDCTAASHVEQPSDYDSAAAILGSVIARADCSHSSASILATVPAIDALFLQADSIVDPAVLCAEDGERGHSASCGHGRSEDAPPCPQAWSAASCSSVSPDELLIF